MDTADAPPRSPLFSLASMLRRIVTLPWRITSKMFVYMWRLVRRIGLVRVALAVLLVLAAAGGGAWLLLHKSPAEKIATAEAGYDEAMANRAFPYASTLMRMAISVDENRPNLWLKLGRSELAQGSFQGALDAYSRVLDYEPENIEALQGVTELSVAGGNYEDAKDYAAQLMRLSPGDVRGSIAAVAIAIRERRFAEAERSIAALFARGIATDDLFLLQSRARQAQDDLPGAIRILEERDRQTPGSAGILGELTALYRKADDRPGVRRTLSRMVALDPTNASFQLAAADDAASAGRKEEAAAAIERVQAGAWDNPDIQLQVIDYWRARKNLPAALLAARRTAANGGPASRIAVAQRLIDIGQPAEGLALIQPVTAEIGQRTSSGAFSAWAVEGNALYALGRLDEARAIADRLLAYDQTNNPALRLRTRLGIDQKRLDQALIDAQLLVQNQPGTLEPLLLLARVQALRGDYGLADVAYASARKAFPDSIETMRESMDYLLRQGRRDEAASLLRDFARGHLDSPVAARLVQDMCRRTPLPGCPARRG